MAKDNTEKPKDNNSSKRPIIRVKKIINIPEEDHGGTWKIAYADFVTAMMAFFMLMWLINTVSQEKLQGIAEFFTPMAGLNGEIGTGLHGGTATLQTNGKGMDENKKKPQSRDSSSSFSNNSFMNTPQSEHSDTVTSIMNNIEKNLQGAEEKSILRDNIIIEKTPEGIKIQVMDSSSRSIFKSGTSELQPYMIRFINVIGNLIKTIPNHIAINGHTSEASDKQLSGKDLWDLSIARADTIRKTLSNLIKEDQLLRITGKSNTDPYDLSNKENPKNGRIDIILLDSSAVKFFQKSDPN